MVANGKFEGQVTKPITILERQILGLPYINASNVIGWTLVFSKLMKDKLVC